MRPGSLLGSNFDPSFPLSTLYSSSGIFHVIKGLNHQKWNAKEEENLKLYQKLWTILIYKAIIFIILGSVLYLTNVKWSEICLKLYFYGLGSKELLNTFNTVFLNYYLRYIKCHHFNIWFSKNVEILGTSFTFSFSEW